MSGSDPKPGTTFQDKTIFIDNSLNSDGLTFIDCEINFTITGRLQLAKTKFSGCRFSGMYNTNDYNEDSGDLHLNESELLGCEIFGVFKSVTILRSKVRDFIDSSSSIRNTIHYSQITNFIIEGWTEHMDYFESYFTTELVDISIWNKTV